MTMAATVCPRVRLSVPLGTVDTPAGGSLHGGVRFSLARVARGGCFQLCGA